MENANPSTKTLVTPARAFFVFVFLIQFLDGLYVQLQIEIPGVFDTLSRIALVSLIWWWLRDDSRRLGITWVLDLGMFLFTAWLVILPYHLFKTRGLKGVIPILAYILVVVFGAAAAVVFVMLTNGL